MMSAAFPDEPLTEAQAAFLPRPRPSAFPVGPGGTPDAPAHRPSRHAPPRLSRTATGGPTCPAPRVASQDDPASPLAAVPRHGGRGQ